MDDNRTSNYSLLIQACRDEYLSQETQNREFSLKTIGIVAFNVTVFAGVITFADPEKMDWVSWSVLLLTFSFLGGTIASAIKVVVPKDWKRPFDIEEVVHKVTKHSEDDMAVDLMEAYAKAINNNWSILDPKAESLNDLTYCATAQVISSALFMLYLFSV